jgi:ATP-dependent DNA ligase
MTVDLLALTGRRKDKFIQLALDMKNIPASKKENLKFPMYASEKFDGVYCIALKHSEWVSIYSRTGELYTSMRHIEDALFEIMEEGKLIIFEAYNPSLDQPTISGYARDKSEQHPSLKAYCHDHLTLGEFVNGGGREFSERLKALYTMIPPQPPEEDYPIVYVNHTSISCGQMARNLAEFIWKDGGEGIVLKNPLATYEGGKRNANIIKVKESVTYDLEIIGISEGKGKYKGMVGTLHFKFKDGKTIKAGSGMTDAQRKEWWDNPEKVIGLIGEVKAMKDSTKGDLREGTFKGIRTDKVKGDY